jgi:CheY-like chemotaxis protein
MNPEPTATVENPAPSSTGESKKILLIEDQEDFVEMFSKRLQDEGYQVSIARDGQAGLEEALTNHYDLIISDILMPTMNGHEMVVKLRETEAGKNIPIFLFSASVEVENLHKLMEAGVVDRVFEKTQLTPSDLAYAVNDFFVGKN